MSSGYSGIESAGGSIIECIGVGGKGRETSKGKGKREREKERTRETEREKKPYPSVDINGARYCFRIDIPTNGSPISVYVLLMSSPNKKGFAAGDNGRRL